MTESEWLSCAHPAPMLEHLRDTAGGRKLRLFACACCRRIWPLLTDRRSREAVEVGESFADGRADEGALAAARASASTADFEAATPDPFGPAAHAAACAFYAAASPAIVTFAAANRAAACLGPGKALKQQVQSHFFRDIIGNPFRPGRFDERWRTTNAVDLARTIYDELAFGRLPILADALMDAGCDSEAVLGHCRSDGEHVRGCWVVDFVLGKS